MKYILHIVAITCTIVLSSCSDKKEATEETQPAATRKVSLVHTADVLKESITTTITTNGRIKKPDNYDLAFPINGTIASIWISKGERVRAGQQIATIKEVSITHRISQSQLSTQKAQNNIEQLQSQLKVSEENLKENKELHGERLITGDQLNSSRLEVEALQNQLNNAIIQLDIVAQEQRILDDQRGLHIFVAPANGIITETLVQSGEQVAAGQPIGILQPDVPMHIFRCTVSDREIIQLYKNSPASISLDAYPDELFNGRVTYISQESSNTGTYEIEITLNQSTKRLLPGMFGNVAISNNQKMDYLAIPMNALIWADGNEGKVMIVNNLKAETRSVQVHKIKGDRVLIDKGLSTTDKVILNANGLISSGDSIAIVKQ